MFVGVGTLVNVATVLVGAVLGVLLGNRLPTRTRDLVTDALGLVTLLIAGTSAWSVLDPALTSYVGEQRADADRARLAARRRHRRVTGPAGGAGRGAGRLAPAAAGGRRRLRGAAPLRRGLRRLVPGVLHRPADDPGLPQRRPGQRRRPALPQGHARRLRGHRVRGVVRLGRGRQWAHGARGPGRCSPWRVWPSATSCPRPTWPRSPRSAGCCSSAWRSGCSGSARSPWPTCCRRWWSRPLLVQAVGALRLTAGLDVAAEVGGLDGVVAGELRAGAGPDDLAGLEDVRRCRRA